MSSTLYSLWGFAFAVKLDEPDLHMDQCLSAALGRLIANGAVIDEHAEFDIDAALFPYDLWDNVGEVGE